MPELGVIESLHAVVDGRKTGTLSIRGLGGSLVVHFTLGSLTGVEGDQLVSQYRSVLERTGKVPEGELGDLWDRFPQESAASNFDAELVKRDYFGWAALKELRVNAMKELLWSTFNWKSAECTFTPARPTRDMKELELSLSTGDVILEGVRRIDDFALIEKGLEGKLDVKLLAPRFQLIEAQLRSLRPEEGFILSRIDGTVTVEQVCDITGLPREQTLRVVFALLMAGLLEFDTPPVVVEKKVFSGQLPRPDASGLEEIDLAGVGLRPEASPPVASESSDDGVASGADAEEATPAVVNVDDLTPRERRARSVELIDKAKGHLGKEHWSKAAVLLKEAVRLGDKDPEAYLLLGTALRQVKGARKEAEDALMRSVDLNHKNPEPYVELGLLYKGMNMLPKARVQFQNALHWDPAHPVAKNELKGDGIQAIKDDLGEAIDGMRETVKGVFKEVFKGKKK